MMRSMHKLIFAKEVELSKGLQRDTRSANPNLPPYWWLNPTLILIRDNNIVFYVCVSDVRGPTIIVRSKILVFGG